MKLKAYFHFNTNILLPQLDDYGYIEGEKLKTIWPMLMSQIYMSSEYFTPSQDK